MKAYVVYVANFGIPNNFLEAFDYLFCIFCRWYKRVNNKIKLYKITYINKSKFMLTSWRGDNLTKISRLWGIHYTLSIYKKNQDTVYKQTQEIQDDWPAMFFTWVVIGGAWTSSLADRGWLMAGMAPEVVWAAAPPNLPLTAVLS